MSNEKDIHGKQIKVGDLIMMVNDKEYTKKQRYHIPTGSLGIVVDENGCYYATFFYSGKIRDAELNTEYVDVEILERHSLKYWAIK